jgi:hypothetical protein
MMVSVAVEEDNTRACIFRMQYEFNGAAAFFAQVGRCTGGSQAHSAGKTKIELCIIG